MAKRESALSLVADARWGAPCLAYNVQIDLTPAARSAIASLGRALRDVDELAVQLSPAASLHVSVYAVAPHHWESPDKEAYWRARWPDVAAALTRLAATHGSTSLRFDSLRILPRAGILVASTPPALVDAVRCALRKGAAPEVPTPLYDLVHTTLGRFASDSSLLPEARRAIEARPVYIASEVTALRVVRERVYPSLVLDELATFPLSG